MIVAACPRAWALSTALLLAALASAGACEGACEEDIRAQTLEERRLITIAAEGETIEVLVEVARSQTERERGWKHRQCDMEGLALALESPTEAPVWMCEVGVALDLLFVRGGELVAVERAAPPCAAPCDACPRYGEGVTVDAVIELPHGQYSDVELAVGGAVSGLTP